jgi:hypothetical protein
VPLKKQKMLEEEQLSLFQVYNAEKTDLFWKAVPETTQANKKDSSVPGRKLNKEHLTALVCDRADESWIPKSN